MTTYKAIAGQSIYDVCLQTYGSLDYLYKLLVDNGIASIDTPILGGQSFTWDDSLVIDQGVNLAFLGTSSRYATDITANGSVFYVMENTPKGLGRDGGLYVVPRPVSQKTIILNTSYVAPADGITGATILDINGQSIAGFDIVQVERDIKPLLAAEYSWNKTTSHLTLLGGISLAQGEQLSILYSKFVTE